MIVSSLKHVCITAIILLLTAISGVSASKTLSIWIMPNGDYPESDLKMFTDKFEEQNPGIKVKIEILSWNNALSRIKMMAKTKKGPDLIQLGSTWTPYIIKTGALLDLTPYMHNIGSYEDYIEPLWSSTHRYGHNEIMAIPWFVDVRAIAINKRHYKNLGFSKDNFSTYKKFKQSLKYFNTKHKPGKDGKVWPITFSGIGDWNLIHNFAPWIWAHGGSFIKEENGAYVSNITSKETIKGIKEYISFYFDKLIDPSDIERNSILTSRKFRDGNAFCLLGTSFGAMTEHNRMVKQGKARIDELDKMILLPYPKGPKGSYTFIGGSNLAITSFTPNRTDAINLLAFLNQDSIAYGYTNQIGTFSPKKNLLTEIPERRADYHKAILQSITIGKSFPNIPEWVEVANILKEGLENIWWQVSGIYGDFNEAYFIKELHTLDYKINKVLTQGPYNNNESDEMFEIELLPTEHKQSQPDLLPEFLTSLGLTSGTLNALIGIILSIVLAFIVLVIAKNKRNN